MYGHRNESLLEQHCRGAIALMPVFFFINAGQVYTQADTHVQDMLGRILTELSRVDDHLKILATPSAQRHVIHAVFDRDTLPLISTGDLEDRLDLTEKARLLVQGIAGAVAVARRLCRLGSTIEVTENLLCRELHRFSASYQPAHIRRAVQSSRLFHDCLMLDEILDLIMEASSDEDDDASVDNSSDGEETSNHSSNIGRGPSFYDYTVDTFSSDFERPSRNMGLPGGFQFQLLN